MQTADIVFRFIGAIILWAFIGFVIAVALKAIQHRDNIPAWPIAVFVLVGVAISVGRQSAAGLLYLAVVTEASAAPAPRVSITSISRLPQPLPQPYDASANADQGVALAKARAAASGKRLLIELGSNWCSDSRALAGILELPEVKSFIELHYEVVTVDVDHFNKNLQIPRHYGVRRLGGIPTPLIIDPTTDKLLNDGHLFELTNAGDMTPQAVVDWLAQWV